MFSRRSVIKGAGAGVASAILGELASAADAGRKKMAILTTEFRMRSHGQHMGDRFLVGFPMHGKWHQPTLDVVSMYVDQVPSGDLSRQREREFGFKIYPTIGEALRRGGDRLAVDAVLIIGEHGKYPKSEYGQTKYPRYEFFKQTAEVFKKDGRTAPVFNDKHLSWNWDWAKEMVETAHSMGFPFMAGSSLPVTFRMPSIDLPYGSEPREIVGVAIGVVDSYDFHALEMMQCLVERRRGGETGVKWLEAMRGASVWKAMAAGSWESGGWDPKLFHACLARTQTLTPPANFSHRYPTDEQIRALVKEPVAYRYEHQDGLRSTMLLLNGLVGDFTVAASFKDGSEPFSTLFYLPPNPNVVYSGALMAGVERMFLTGKAVYPVERTLLTSGLVAAATRSLTIGKREETPHLAVQYQVPSESLFWQR